MAVALDTARMVRGMEATSVGREQAEAFAEVCKSTYEAVSSDFVTEDSLVAVVATLKGDMKVMETRIIQWSVGVGIGVVAVILACTGVGVAAFLK